MQPCIPFRVGVSPSRQSTTPMAVGTRRCVSSQERATWSPPPCQPPCPLCAVQRDRYQRPIACARHPACCVRRAESHTDRCRMTGASRLRHCVTSNATIFHPRGDLQIEAARVEKSLWSGRGFCFANSRAGERQFWGTPLGSHSGDSHTCPQQWTELQ